jgi:hypothetical protein
MQPMRGPRSRYRGKLRARPLSILLTPEGHAALVQGCDRTGLSRSDFIEQLVRRSSRQGTQAGKDKLVEAPEILLTR